MRTPKLSQPMNGSLYLTGWKTKRLKWDANEERSYSSWAYSRWEARNYDKGDTYVHSIPVTMLICQHLAHYAEYSVVGTSSSVELQNYYDKNA